MPLANVTRKFMRTEKMGLFLRESIVYLNMSCAYVTFPMICFGSESGQKNAVNLPQNVFYFPKRGMLFYEGKAFT